MMSIQDLVKLVVVGSAAIGVVMLILRKIFVKD